MQKGLSASKFPSTAGATAGPPHSGDPVAVPAPVQAPIQASTLDPQEALRLEASFIKDLEKDRFVLTSLPEIAFRVRNVLDDPKVTASEIAAIVNTDPAIAAKLIRVCNSPLYRTWEPCDTVTQALVRLGITTTRQLVVSFTLKDLFEVDIAPLKQAMRESWRHIIYHGAIAWVIASESGRFSPEEALSAALMSNIGVLSVSHYLANHPEIYRKPGGIDNTINMLKSRIGAMVLERWGLSGQLIECARQCDNWEREHSGEPDLCDVVIVAALHAYIGRRRVPALEALPAFQRLQIAGLLDPRKALSFLESASDQVSAARALLDF